MNKNPPRQSKGERPEKRRRLQAICGVSAALCAAAPGAVAQLPSPQEVVVSADDVVKIALTNNFDIRISRIQVQLDQFAINGDYGHYDPLLTATASHNFFSQPGGLEEFDGEVFPVPTTITHEDAYNPGISGQLPTGLTYNLSGALDNNNTEGQPREYEGVPGPGITLDQPLLKNLWIDNTRYTITVARNALKTDQQAFRLQVMTTVHDVKTAYYKLISARENVKVQQDGLALKQQTVSDDKQEVQLGSMRALDEKQAESEAATAESAVQTALVTLAAQENTLKSLLGVRMGELDNFTLTPAEQLIAVPEHPQPQECWRTGLEQRPEMLQAKLRIERQHVTIKYDFNQLFPQLDVTGTYGHNATETTLDGALADIANGSHPYYSYGLSLTVPLGNRAARNTYKGDRAALESLLWQAKKEEWAIVTAIDNDIKNVEADLLNVDYTRQARVYAEQALEAGQMELKLGKIAQFDVLQFQDNLTSARSAEVSALSDYNTALEQLALDEGTTLERNHIDLRFR